jgi:hypothetical protein
MFNGQAPFVRAEDDLMRADANLKKALNLYSPEGRRLQVACRACAQERLREHKGRVQRVAERLLQLPHKIDGATFEQLMQAES